MEMLRKPFQGVTNIIRFNRHFYLPAIIILPALLVCNFFLHNNFHFYINIFCILAIATTFISLLASFYIYDLSGLYSLRWLDKLPVSQNGNLVNINAGFDETSELLASKYPASELHVFDFYDPQKHTEVSIKRARKAYPPYKNTIKVTTAVLPLESNSADNIFLIFSAHEIRSNDERVCFFKELNRIVKDDGKIIITEHLRNLSNFTVYNIGFFHFLSLSNWLAIFKKSNFKICDSIKITPFITTFILTKNGMAS